MIKRILKMTVKDWRLLTRNYYVAAILVIGLLYVLATRFMIPAELNTGNHFVLWDQTAGQIVRRAYEAQASDPTQLTIVDSAEAYASAVAGNNRIGLRVIGEAMPEQFEVTFSETGRKVVYELTARSAFNPFALPQLQRFQCPANL